MTPRPRHRRLAPALVLLALAGPAQAHEWWLIFGTGDTPRRDLFAVDLESLSTLQSPPGAQQLQVVQVFEAQDMPSHMLFQLQYRCDSRQVRLSAAQAVLRTGGTTQLPVPDGWKAVPQSWLDRGYQFVCAPQQREQNDMLRIGQMDQPTMLAMIHQGLFKEAPSAPPLQKPESSVDRVMRDLDALLGGDQPAR